MKKYILIFIVFIAFSSKLMAANILLVIGDLSTSNVDNATDTIKNALISDGHNVTDLRFVSTTTSGEIKTELDKGIYDQVFFLDLAQTLFLASQDVTAIANFWDSSKGLVIDTRSYGYFLNPTKSSEIALIQNVANTFTISNGGLWIGSDDAPMWAYNANAILSAMNMNQVIGNYRNPINYADPNSVLLQNVTPTDLLVITVGAAPIGIQPNGTEMFAHVGYDNGGGTIRPYISANFPLSGPTPYIPPITPANTADPRAIPSSSLWALMLVAFTLLGLAKRKFS